MIDFAPELLGLARLALLTISLVPRAIFLVFRMPRHSIIAVKLTPTPAGL